MMMMMSWTPNYICLAVVEYKLDCKYITIYRQPIWSAHRVVVKILRYVKSELQLATVMHVYILDVHNYIDTGVKVVSYHQINNLAKFEHQIGGFFFFFFFFFCVCVDKLTCHYQNWMQQMVTRNWWGYSIYNIYQYFR